MIALMAMTLLTALGTALVLATMTETAISANYRDATETFYAADALVEFVVQDLGAAPDWNRVVAGSATSAFVDGPPSGTRTVGALALDLTEATLDINASVATTAAGDSPQWSLYAFGRFDDLVPSEGHRSRIYVVAWVVDRSDMPGEEQSVPDVLSVLGQAYGPNGSRRAVEATVTRADTSAGAEPNPIRVLSWRELR